MRKSLFLEVPCIEVTQPIGSFFIGAMKAEDLVRISDADRRELRDKKDQLREYVGIQRQLSLSRVQKLKDYVKTADATFPTAVILAIRTYGDSGTEYSADEQLPNVIHDENRNILQILNNEKVAKIIDGQHRIEGLRELGDSDFKVNVAIFVDMAIEDQAMVFATINLQQTKVSKSLAYDLFEYQRSRSPQKTCHDIVRLLNKVDGSPFKNRIKILGKAEGPNETITQATFIDRLIDYISKRPAKDRDIYKRGKVPTRDVGDASPRLIFRNLFLDEKDAVIARNVRNFFTAVQSKWPAAWDVVERGNILNRSTGFGALMRFLRPAYTSLQKDEKGLVSVDEYSKAFSVVALDAGDFTPDNFKPGSSGEGQLYRTLLQQSGLG